MFQIPKKEAKVNVWLLAIIFIPLGMALAVLWHFHVEPIYTLTTGWLTPIVEGARGIGQTVIPTIQNYVTQKPEVLATIGMGAITLIAIPLAKNYFQNQKLKAEAQAQQAITDNINLGQSYSELEAKYKVAQAQLKTTQTTDSQGLVTEAQNLVTQKNMQMEKMKIEHQTAIQTLQNEIDRLKIQVKEVIVVK